MSSTLNTDIVYEKKDLPPLIKKLAIGLTAVGLLLVILGYFTDHTRSAFNNIVLLMFLTSIGLGSLFLIAIEYLGGAVWSTPFRRIPEILGGMLLILPIIAIPVYLNLHELYHGTHANVVAGNELLSHKSGYLNQSFFTIRVIGYFVIWILFYLLLTRNSKKQDITKDQSITKTNTKISAVFVPFFAITVTFSAIDWMMSL